MSDKPPFLGIDFGTSKSTMAWFNPRTGQAEIIKNAEGEEKTPSVVYFGTDGVLVGTPAENKLEEEEERRLVFVSIKRDLGSSKRLALPAGRQVTPLEMVAEIVLKLKHDAEAGHFHEPVERLVLTCPAAFSEIERTALADAARRVGFHAVELLEEPVAAALAYAHAGFKPESHLLVYDLGGGTFDLAVLTRDETGFRLALGPKGIRRCGGDDFDRALYDYCDGVARQTLQRSISGDEGCDLHFLRLCRQRKENLTNQNRCDFSSYLPGAVRFKQSLDRDTFEKLIYPRVKETIEATRRLLKEACDAGIPIETVVLIGGSSRVPLVESLLKDALRPTEPKKWHQADFAVALGAAWWGHERWGQRPRPAPRSMTKTARFLGIDFGTSQSSMAWFNPKTGQAEVIRNAEGEDKTPSVVYYGDSETLVGKAAEDLLENERERGRILFSIKRHLVKRVRYSLGRRHIRPVDVVAEILRKLKRDAEGHLDEPVGHAVITHPGAFDQLDNDKLTEAAGDAGFADVVLLPAPVAAAIAYAEAGLNIGDHVLVYDLGGGTFDLALLNRSHADNPFSLAAEPRGLRCGGDDFDQLLYDHCDAIAQSTLGRPIGINGQDLHFLRECRRRKEDLSIRNLSEFSWYLSGSVQFKHTIDRESFEKLIGSTVQATVSLTRTMFDNAIREGHQPDSVVLIGGSSQVPLVQRLLREALPIEPVKWQGRDLAAALGAAYHGRRLWGSGPHAVKAIRAREDSEKQTVQIDEALGGSPSQRADPAEDLLAQVNAALGQVRPARSDGTNAPDNLLKQLESLL